MALDWSNPYDLCLILAIAVFVFWALVDGWRKAASEQGLIEAAANRTPREPAELPAILIQRGTSAFSRIGDLPQLPDRYDWPLDTDGAPLAFLCQIALRELPSLARDLRP